jgi:hypothetical protein
MRDSSVCPANIVPSTFIEAVIVIIIVFVVVVVVVAAAVAAAVVVVRLGSRLNFLLN